MAKCHGKEDGGLVGIIQISSAISRLTLSFNLRIMLSSQTVTMLGLTSENADEYTHNECSYSRIKRGDYDEGSIAQSLQQHGVF